MSGPAVAPHGSWRSAIDVDTVVAAAGGLGEPWIDGDDVYWLEGRPAEAGRRTLFRRGLDGVVRELTPAPLDIRTRVHEYGGGSYTVAGGVVVASSFPDGRLLRLDREGRESPVPLTPEGPWRYADLRLDLARRRVLAVREDHTGGGRPENTIVDIPLDGASAPGRVLAFGADFYAAPRVDHGGRRMLWLEWNDPDMPWDATTLVTADVAPDGRPGAPAAIAGGHGESIVQPEFGADGAICFVSDRSDWWNVYRRLDDGTESNLAPLPAECADPPWLFDRSSYGFAPDGGMLIVARADGRDRLGRRDADGTLRWIETTYTELEGLRVTGSLAIAIAAGPCEPGALVRFDVGTGRPAGVLAVPRRVALDPAFLPEPEPISFPTTGGAVARALFFPPTNPGFKAPGGAAAPLLVLSHGGPTSNASSALSLERAFWTSRGIAVVDVDYRGSTGYGRAYRAALRGQWGIADVDDCVAAARFLVERGDVDPARMAIAGGSAGGYTTLATLTFRPGVFAAGISQFGIGDLELLRSSSHKFEARYEESLIAPWPGGRAVYRERSPNYFLDRMTAPMLILQGLDDRVVPPANAEAIVAALEARGIPHAALFFEGEGHGFRRSETLRASLEARLSFLGQVFGFEPADSLPKLEIRGLQARG